MQEGKTDRANRYKNFKDELLNDKSICKENRDFWKEFLTHQERKLKRTNDLVELDNGAYKTLYYYLIRFKNMNAWFQNKPWKDLTKDDIRRVYDDLEEGRIKSQRGTRYASREDYYSKIMKSTPFEMLGKAELAREVIQYVRPTKNNVRFILEDDFRKLVEQAGRDDMRLLLWLAFDLGENINSLLLLRKTDFLRQENPDTNESEYRVNFRKEILKRTRQSRSEITLYPETVELLDKYLQELKPAEQLFTWGYHNATRTFRQIAAKAKVVVIPDGSPVTWKDLRSGMACDLLKKGWTTDEVNARLGHKPSSEQIDKYVSFLAINRHRPKRKVEAFKSKEMERELEQFRQREKLNALRMKEMEEQMGQLSEALSVMPQVMENPKLKEKFKERLARYRT